MSATLKSVDAPTAVIIDLGPMCDGVTPIVPIPEDAPPPKLARFGRTKPDHVWSAFNEHGQRIGTLCYYAFGLDKDVVGLWVYGTKSGTRNWHFKAGDMLKRLVEERGLTAHEEASVIFAPDGAPEPPRVAGADPQIVLPAQVLISPVQEAVGALVDGLLSENNVRDEITTVPAGAHTGSTHQRTGPATVNTTGPDDHGSMRSDVQSAATQVPTPEEPATAPPAKPDLRPARPRRRGTAAADDTHVARQPRASANQSAGAASAGSDRRLGHRLRRGAPRPRVGLARPHSHRRGDDHRGQS